LNFFKKEFTVPIEKKNQQEKEEKLKKLINPYILRRKKDEVAVDLPPVSEQIIYCSMTDEQRKFYESEKSIIRNSIFEKIDNQGVEKSSMIVLQGLTRLRQIANHPLLVDEQYADESGKFNEISRNIENIILEGHKVLVFSSFVKHLEIVETYIKTEKIKYTMLTGESLNREGIVKAFQNNPECKVFLISLKAGGVGLNLTAADYVFILDPWWNPASESQALNRAHRIGQDKKVFVYRFISENSIEEKIQMLQERKSNLAATFIHSNNPMKDISKKANWQLLSNKFTEPFDLFGDGVIEVYPTPGHTPGHQSLLVKLADTSFFITSDSCYTEENLHEMIPPGLVWNADKSLRTVNWIRDIQKERNLTVVTGHDPQAWDRFKKAPAYYS